MLTRNLSFEVLAPFAPQLKKEILKDVNVDELINVFDTSTWEAGFYRITDAYPEFSVDHVRTPKMLMIKPGASYKVSNISTDAYMLYIDSEGNYTTLYANIKTSTSKTITAPKNARFVLLYTGLYADTSEWRIENVPMP